MIYKSTTISSEIKMYMIEKCANNYLQLTNNDKDKYSLQRENIEKLLFEIKNPWLINLQNNNENLRDIKKKFFDFYVCYMKELTTL